MEKELKGKAALITGSAGGIGLGCAKALAKRGANIALVDIIDTDSAKKEIEKLYPNVKVITINVDVREREQVENAVKLTVETFGSINILVNNAGTASRLSLEEMTDEMWMRDIDTNLRGTFLFTKAAIYPYMKEQKEGKIINISSVSGINGGAISYNDIGERTGRSGPAYAASKGGVIALTKWVAKEVGEFGINVNSVAPGLVETEITRGAEYPLDLQVVKRSGQPEDIGEAVAYLASPQADYVMGQILRVDGGMVIS